MDKYPPPAQRSVLLHFAEALKSRTGALRRDECGDWRINGSRGHIYAIPEGFQIFVIGWSVNGWNRAKKALSFARLTQEGDDEGGFIFDRMPTRAEADEIRHYCGIAKRVEYQADYRAELRERALRARQKIGRKPEGDARPVERGL